MNFKNIKKYLDLRKYISFNLLAIIGLSLTFLCLIWNLGSIRLDNSFFYTLCILLMASTPVILILLVISIFEFIYKKLKYTEKENQTTTKKESKKPKTLLFFILELIYSLLFALGLVVTVGFCICGFLALLLGPFFM